MQYYVAFEGGTETPYENRYWDMEEEGIYKSIVMDQPVFSSRDKYDGKTGWPTFKKAIEGAPILERKNYEYENYGMRRTEVSCITEYVHLGHLYNDGPDGSGQRYSINSASLQFVSVHELTSIEKLKYGFDNSLNNK